MPISVVIADDHPVVLQGLTRFIDEGAQFSVIAAVSNGEMALAAIDSLMPALAVLDLRMPVMSALEVLRRLQGRAAGPRVVLLTAGGSDAELFDCISAGAAGVVLKEAAASELLACLSEVAAGGTWLPSDTVRTTLVREQQRRADWQRLSAHLTNRELQLIPLVLSNRSNKQIADALGLSEGTVKVHLNSVFRKLQVYSRAELVERARGLIAG